jgi:hypothetical protein
MGRGARKEPDLDNFVKRLGKGQSACTEELRALFDCMLRSGLADVDASCGKQRVALAMCAQNAGGRGVKSKLAAELKRVASLWKKFGF